MTRLNVLSLFMNLSAAGLPLTSAHGLAARAIWRPQRKRGDAAARGLPTCEPRRSNSSLPARKEEFK